MDDFYIFDLVKYYMEIFMDDFSMFGSSFDDWSSFDDSLTNLDKVLKKCRDKYLTLNWKKCQFMVKKGIVLGHVISTYSIEVAKAKIDLIANLPPSRCAKDD